jgi:hypothetical protein
LPLIDRLEIRRGRRNLDVVLARYIEGAVPADAQVGAGRADQRFGLRQDQVFGKGWRGCAGICRQLRALFGVEHREAFEKGDCLRLLARLFGTTPFAVGNKAVGIDDRRSLLGLADMTAERERLAEGEPALAGEAARGDGAP